MVMFFFILSWSYLFLFFIPGFTFNASSVLLITFASLLGFFLKIFYFLLFIFFFPIRNFQNIFLGIDAFYTFCSIFFPSLFFLYLFFSFLCSFAFVLFLFFGFVSLHPDISTNKPKRKRKKYLYKKISNRIASDSDERKGKKGLGEQKKKKKEKRIRKKRKKE